MSVTFNGTTLPLAHLRDSGLGTRDKVVEFPGNDGVEVLPMGLGAREIIVECVSTSGSPSRSTLEGLMDDETHTLSADGDTFSNVRCISVARVAKVKDQALGAFREYYVLTFRQEKPD